MENINAELLLAKSQIDHFNKKHTASSCTRARSHLLMTTKHINTLRKQLLQESKDHKASKTKPAAAEAVEAVEAEIEPVESVPVVPMQVKPTKLVVPVLPKKRRTRKAKVSVAAVPVQ